MTEVTSSWSIWLSEYLWMETLVTQLIYGWNLSALIGENFAKMVTKKFKWSAEMVTFRGLFIITFSQKTPNFWMNHDFL